MSASKREKSRNRVKPISRSTEPANRGTRETRRSRVIGYLNRHSHELSRDAIILLLGTALVFIWDARLEARQRDFETSIQREQVRLQHEEFVRTASMSDNSSHRPFSSLFLDGSNLSLLKLDCDWAPDPANIVTQDDMNSHLPPDLRPPGGDIVFRHNRDLEDSGCANFESASLQSTNFRRSVMDGALFNRAKAGGVNFEEASVRFAQFVEADLSRANFEGALVSGAYFSGAEMQGAVFEEAIVVNSDFEFADLSATTFRLTDIRGSSFRDAKVGDATFGNVCYDEYTIFPDGYSPPPSSCEDVLMYLGIMSLYAADEYESRKDG